MAKYSFEFKKKVVEEYLLGRGSTHELGKKYHSYSGCSNMKGPSKVTEKEAINRGFTACKKCW